MPVEIEPDVEDVEAEVEVPFVVADESDLRHVVVVLLLDALLADIDLMMTIMTITTITIVIILAAPTPLQLAVLVGIKHTLLRQLQILLCHLAAVATIKRLLPLMAVVVVVVVMVVRVVSTVIEVIQDLRNILAPLEDMALHQLQDTSHVGKVHDFEASGKWLFISSFLQGPGDFQNKKEKNKPNKN